MRTVKERKIEKLRRDIKYSITQVELWQARIDTEEKRIKDRADKITELENAA